MNKSPHKLPFVELKDKKLLPSISGIYFAMQEDEVLYVGKSINIRSRWKHHHKTSELSTLENIKIHWMPCDECALHNTESDHIRYFNPPMNYKVSQYFKITRSVKLDDFLPERILYIFAFIGFLILFTILVMALQRTDDSIRVAIEYIQLLVLIAVVFITGAYEAWREAKKKISEQIGEDDL